MNIEELRSEIDQIDNEICALFEKRMNTAKEIALYKKQNNLPVLDSNREKIVLDRIGQKVSPGFSNFAKKLYTCIFELSREYQNGFVPQKKYGLLGRNISYSFSKEIHGALADYDYNLINLEPEEFDAFLNSHQLAGCNVTIPYKRNACALCNELSPQAKRIGGVNTVVLRSDGTLYGDNTDYYGFLYMAQRAGIDFKGKNVLIFGDGATSATVQAVVGDQGGKITVISRRGENNYENVSRFYDSAEILINATPVGTSPNTDNQIVDVANFTKVEGVLDVVYNPVYTRFVQGALECGIKASSGLPMLVAQAKRSCELFIDREIPDEKTEEIIKRILRQKQNIVLTGMPGCGKSTVAKLLAQSLNRQIIDLDAEIEKSEGCKIPEIFEKHGEEYFRAKESEIVAKFAEMQGAIIATGGGAILNTRNRRNLRKNGFVVFIQRNLENLPVAGRPLSQRKGVEKIYEERLPIYQSFADICVDNNSQIETTVNTILEQFK